MPALSGEAAPRQEPPPDSRGAGAAPPPPEPADAAPPPPEPADAAPPPPEPADAAPPPPEPAGATRSSLPVSRRGGAILLGVLAVIVVVAVVLIVSSGGSSQPQSRDDREHLDRGGTEAQGTIQLHAAAPRSGSTGAVEILAEGAKRAFYIQAEHLPETKGFFYAVWLYNSPTSALALSKGPSVGTSHKLAGRGAAAEQRRQTTRRSCSPARRARARTQPGQVVLRGTLALRPRPAGPPAQQLAGVHDPRRVELALTARSSASSLRADLALHPRRVIATDRVVVGDRAAGRRRSPRWPPLHRAPLLDLRALAAGGRGT